MMVRKGRAGTQIRLARRTGDATNLSLLDSGEVRTWADAQAWMSRAEQVVAYHNRRIERLEARMDRVDGGDDDAVEGTADEL
jgi:hypothetical protein